MFNGILFAVFVSVVCGLKTGEIVNHNDVIFWYPHFQDECIERCGIHGTCTSLQGYVRYCSAKVGYTWSNKMCTGPCEPNTYDVSNSSTKHVYTYYHCTTDTTTRGWDFCSLHKYRSTTHQTIYGRSCTSSCQKILSPSKYKNQSVCSIGFSGSEILYEGCSENYNVTYKGEECTSACIMTKSNLFEDSYTCETGLSSSDYCGLVYYLPAWE